MPLREYSCAKCGHQFEVLESVSATTESCEACGSKQIEKLLSVFAAHGAPSGDNPCADFGCSTESCAAGTCPALAN